MTARRPLLALLPLLPLLALPVSRPQAAPREAQVGDLLPDWPLRGLNGPDRRLGAYHGRPLIINVWASWCGPCRAESASLERLAWLDSEERFAVIGISTDDYRDKALGWLRASNATLNHFIDQRLELETLLGARHIPLTVLVDAEGRVVAKVDGAREWDSAESRAFIRRAFAKPVAGARPRP
ncbi:MAG: TlpA disulfide reductase family protein [Rubrivivax sp.]